MSIWVSFFLADLINEFVLGNYFIRQTKIKNKKFYIVYIISLVLLAILSSNLVLSAPTIIRTISKILITTLLFKMLFKDNFPRILIPTFIIYIIFAFCDSIVGIFYLGILKIPISYFNDSVICILSANLLIAFLSFCILKAQKVNNIIHTISKWYAGKRVANLVVLIVLCVTTLWFFFMRNTQSNISFSNYIMNFIVIGSVIVMILGIFKENSDKNQLKKGYDNLLDYAKTYEQEVVEKSKWQHEYENQLVIIKDKIDPENKKALIYIDKLLKNKPSVSNTQWLIKLSKFPDIGIKGLLHYKICQMIQNNIQVYVDVIDEDLIPSKVPEALLEENLQDISMALGVYLDNAMQAANESDNKFLIVEFKCTDKKIEFQISNTYKGNISLDKIGQERFSTKGKNHGYGLSIVRDILSRNKHLKQEKELNGMYYVQRLIFNFK